VIRSIGVRPHGLQLTRQKTRQDRDLLNNRRIYQDVEDGARGMLACAGTSGRRNAIYRTDELNRGMMRGAVMDASVGGCAAASVRAGGGGPSDRWYAGAIRSSARTPCRSHPGRRYRASRGSCAMRAESPGRDYRGSLHAPDMPVRQEAGWRADALQVQGWNQVLRAL